MYTQAPLALNLGGDTEKTKIKPTDKSTGVFDFSLASIGMYKVPEYYSAELAKEQPNKFVEFDSDLLHTGSTCTDEQRRVVLNLNYIV